MPVQSLKAQIARLPVEQTDGATCSENVTTFRPSPSTKGTHAENGACGRQNGLARQSACVLGEFWMASGTEETGGADQEKRKENDRVHSDWRESRSDGPRDLTQPVTLSTDDPVLMRYLWRSWSVFWRIRLSRSSTRPRVALVVVSLRWASINRRSASSWAS